ncbi:energy transducer TonB [Chitinophaga arvensicola]|uniref:TonB family C-terminal domain-containing protein n=1 Tax=Chitinophaga arvensicola TaxID=29529 RepID=A0A1I0SE97_9BACT|nr:energy transducer TonB [Chitinophaga arvensicola]SEW54629.1 TonB family C-terminal domain-containing protein [Chitinophaga arvensicola]
MFYFLLLALGIPLSDTAVKPVTAITPEELIVCPVEEMPTFPGGETALKTYLEKNIVYPAAALKAKVSGTVFIQFIVDKTGLIGEAHPVGSFKGYGMEAEALRVICMMPKWKPGKQGGMVVSTFLNLPIRFTIPPPEKQPIKKRSL